MNEHELSAQWAALEPTAEQRHRMENRVLDWLEAHETSLAAEWLALLKIHPAAGLGYVTVGALSLFIVTPLGWLASTVLS